MSADTYARMHFRPLTVFVMAPVIGSLLVDLPARLTTQGVSLLALLSILYPYLFLVCLLYVGKNTNLSRAFVVASVAFLAYCLLSLVSSPLSQFGIQNFVSYVGFFLGVIASYAYGERHFKDLPRLWRVLQRLFLIVTSPLALLNLALHGWGSGVVGSTWFLGPRSFAFVALIPLALNLGTWRAKRRRRNLALALWWLLLIFSSMSRTALIIGLLMLVMSELGRDLRSVMRVILMSAVVVAIFLGMLTLSPNLRQRFTQGDTSLSVFGTSLNAAGRTRIWAEVAQSATERVFFGKGLGSSSRLVAQAFPGLEHPHNDFLRIWHDLGLAGLLLFSAPFGLLFCKLLMSFSRGTHPRDSFGLIGAATMCVFGMLIGMLTDNVVVYAFVSLPIAVLTGSAIAILDSRPMGGS
jgi:O-antigen ligase